MTIPLPTSISRNGHSVLQKEGGTVYLDNQFIQKRKLDDQVIAYFKGDELEIRLSHAHSDFLDILIYDVNGRLLFREEHKNMRGSARLEMHPGIEKQGIYFVRVYGDAINEVVRVFRY